MAANRTADQLVKSLSFEVEASPNQDTIEVKNGNNMTPLNVKVRVRKKEEAKGTLREGVIAIPQRDGAPERLRLASSDQTIVSFNLLMEADFEKKPHRKPRRSFFGMCLGAQSEDDDCQYLPASSEKGGASRSDSGMLKNKVIVVPKQIEDRRIKESLKKKDKKLFGKCKAGGCLDPPFGEEKYAYQPTARTNAPVPKITDLENVKKQNVPKKEADTEKIKIGKEAAPIILSKGKDREDVSDSSVLSLYQGQPNSVLEDNESDSIITYPPTLSSSGILNDEEKGEKSRRCSRPSKQSGRSFNEFNATYYSPPNKTPRESKTGKRASQILDEIVDGSNAKNVSQNNLIPVLAPTSETKAQQNIESSSPNKEEYFDAKKALRTLPNGSDSNSQINPDDLDAVLASYDSKKLRTDLENLKGPPRPQEKEQNKPAEGLLSGAVIKTVIDAEDLQQKTVTRAPEINSPKNKDKVQDPSLTIPGHKLETVAPVSKINQNAESKTAIADDTDSKVHIGDHDKEQKKVSRPEKESPFQSNENGKATPIQKSKEYFENGPTPNQKSQLSADDNLQTPINKTKSTTSKTSDKALVCSEPSAKDEKSSVVPGIVTEFGNEISSIDQKSAQSMSSNDDNRSGSPTSKTLSSGRKSAEDIEPSARGSLPISKAETRTDLDDEILPWSDKKSVQSKSSAKDTIQKPISKRQSPNSITGEDFVSGSISPNASQRTKGSRPSSESGFKKFDNKVVLPFTDQVSKNYNIPMSISKTQSSDSKANDHMKTELPLTDQQSTNDNIPMSISKTQSSDSKTNNNMETVRSLTDQQSNKDNIPMSISKTRSPDSKTQQSNKDNIPMSISKTQSPDSKTNKDTETILPLTDQESTNDNIPISISKTRSPDSKTNKDKEKVLPLTDQASNNDNIPMSISKTQSSDSRTNDNMETVQSLTDPQSNKDSKTNKGTETVLPLTDQESNNDNIPMSISKTRSPDSNTNKDMETVPPITDQASNNDNIPMSISKTRPPDSKTNKDMETVLPLIDQASNNDNIPMSISKTRPPDSKTNKDMETVLPLIDQASNNDNIPLSISKTRSPDSNTNKDMETVPPITDEASNNDNIPMSISKTRPPDSKTNKDMETVLPLIDQASNNDNIPMSISKTQSSDSKTNNISSPLFKPSETQPRPISKGEIRADLIGEVRTWSDEKLIQSRTSSKDPIHQRISQVQNANGNSNEDSTAADRKSNYSNSIARRSLKADFKKTNKDMLPSTDQDMAQGSIILQTDESSHNKFLITDQKSINSPPRDREALKAMDKKISVDKRNFALLEKIRSSITKELASFSVEYTKLSDPKVFDDDPTLSRSASHTTRISITDVSKTSAFDAQNQIIKPDQLSPEMQITKSDFEKEIEYEINIHPLEDEVGRLPENISFDITISEISKKGATADKGQLKTTNAKMSPTSIRADSFERKRLVRSPITEIDIPPKDVIVLASQKLEENAEQKEKTLDASSNIHQNPTIGFEPNNISSDIVSTGIDQMSSKESTNTMVPKMVQDASQQTNVPTSPILKTTSQASRQVRVKEGETPPKDTVFLDLAFEAHADENQVVVRTLDSTVADSNKDGVILVKSLFRSPDKTISVPIDVGHVMSIGLKPLTASRTDPYLNAQKYTRTFDTAGHTSASGISLRASSLQSNISSIYNRDLVPLQDVIKSLKDDVDDLVTRQIMLQDVLGRKRLRHIRTTQSFSSKKCCCIRK